MRLRNHDPKKSKGRDMGRLVATVMLNALAHDVEVRWRRREAILWQDVHPTPHPCQSDTAPVPIRRRCSGAAWSSCRTSRASG